MFKIATAKLHSMIMAYGYMKQLTAVVEGIGEIIVEAKRTYSTSFCEASITLVLKLSKDNYRLISLLKTHAKILNKILANKIKQCIKSITGNY